MEWAFVMYAAPLWNNKVHIGGEEQGPCWSLASALNGKSNRDTGGAYEICYCCQGNAWELELKGLCFIFSLYLKDRTVGNLYIKCIQNFLKNVMTQKFGDKVVRCYTTYHVHPILMWFLWRCSQTGNHWHSCTWSTTCHYWQLNRQLTHTSVYGGGDASHSGQGHKAEVIFVLKPNIVFVFQPVCLFYCILHLHWAPFRSLKKNKALFQVQ